MIKTPTKTVWTGALCAALSVALFYSGEAADPGEADDSSEEGANVTGVWEWAYTASNGLNLKSTLEAQMIEGKPWGMCQGVNGQSALIREARVEEGVFSFKVVHRWRDEDLTFQFKGRLKGDQLRGSVQLEGADRSFDWTANRISKSIPKPDPNGIWKWTQFSDSQLTLRRGDDGISGVFSDSRGRTTTVEDLRLIGSYLFFKVSASVQGGNQYKASYQGRIVGDAIEGSYDYEYGTRKGTRRWEAQRDPKTSSEVLVDE